MLRMTPVHNDWSWSLGGQWGKNSDCAKICKILNRRSQVRLFFLSAVLFSQMIGG